MMPMRKKKVASPRTQTASVPAPIGGLNARDSIANMPPTDAVYMDNMFPTPTSVDLRGGSSAFATTDGSSSGDGVETLMAYNGVSTKKLFGIDSAGITDITSGGTITPPSVTSLSNARFQYINFGTAGGHYISCVNGADSARLFDGTTWSTPTITGATSSDFIHVNSFKNRLWYTQKDSTLVWYLPLNSISGAATSFDLGPLFRLGGYLMGMVTWTINDTSGMDDYAVFVSSEGDAVVYRGYDPSSASTWSLVGQFRIGRPIGRRFYCKIASDVVLLTVDGVIPLSQALLVDRATKKITLSDKIDDLISKDILSYSGNFGWQVILHPANNKLVVNTPVTETTRHYQYVMNTITKAWCTFGYTNPGQSWNAYCFEIFNDILYYGTYNDNGFGEITSVFKCDVGTQDNAGLVTASAIYGYAKPAFSYFGARGQQKYFTLARPILQVDGQMYAAMELSVDFEKRAFPSNYYLQGTGGISPWNTSLWNVSFWSQSGQVQRDWQTVNGIGFSASLLVAVISSVEVSWQSTDYVYQLGGTL
jgi:hypothetical protein